MAKLGSALSATTKQKILQAVVIDVLGKRCSVRISGSGQKLTGLNFTGSTPSRGDRVMLDYRGASGAPVVITSTPDVQEEVSLITASPAAPALVRRSEQEEEQIVFPEVNDLYYVARNGTWVELPVLEPIEYDLSDQVDDNVYEFTLPEKADRISVFVNGISYSQGFGDFWFIPGTDIFEFWAHDLFGGDSLMVKLYKRTTYGPYPYTTGILSVEGLHLWWNADGNGEDPPFVNGEVAEVVIDRSPYAYHGFAFFPGLQPTYVENVQNGKPAFRFSGTQAFASSNIYLDQATVFVVWSRANTGDNYALFDGYRQNGDAWIAAPPAQITLGMDLNRVYLKELEYTGSEINFYTNGILSGSVVSTARLEFTGAGNWFYGLNGDIFAVLIFELLSETDRKTIEEELIRIYGIT